jgi:hypothetical protein
MTHIAQIAWQQPVPLECLAVAAQAVLIVSPAVDEVESNAWQLSASKLAQVF